MDAEAAGPLVFISNPGTTLHSPRICSGSHPSLGTLFIFEEKITLFSQSGPVSITVPLTEETGILMKTIPQENQQIQPTQRRRRVFVVDCLNLPTNDFLLFSSAYTGLRMMSNQFGEYCWAQGEKCQTTVNLFTNMALFSPPFLFPRLYSIPRPESQIKKAKRVERDSKAVAAAKKARKTVSTNPA